MTELKTFNFADLELRVLIIEDEPWFAGADIRKAMGLSYYGNWAGYLNDDETQVVRKGGSTSFKGHGLKVVSESGLYKLIMRSDKPEARKFQDWVTREVLPAIRKTGGYLLNEEARETAKADDRQAMPLPEEFAQVMQHLAEITAINKELVETNRKLVELLQSQPAPAPEVKDETPTLAREFIRTNRLGCSSSDLGWAATKYCNDRGIYFVEGSGNRSNRYPRWVLEIVAPGVFA